MIRNLLATTAIATLLATGAVAQTQNTTAPAADPTAQQPVEMKIRAEGHLASNIIGEAVYNGTGEDAEKIGSVEDLVIDPEGNVEAIVVGVGGFLGIGKKEVALEYDLATWSEQQDGERWLIVETTADALKAQEEFDRAAFRPMPADAQIAEPKPVTAEDLAAAPKPEEATEEGAEVTAEAPAEGETEEMAAEAPAEGEVEVEVVTEEQAEGETEEMTAEATAEGEAETEITAEAPAEGETGEMVETETVIVEEEQQTAASEDRQDRPEEETTAAATEEQATEADPTQTAAIDRSRLQEARPEQLSAENLTGTSVYGANEDRIGEIGDVILTTDGEVDAIVVDVGGFLGIGEKPVAIGMDKLTFMTDENGELYLYTEFTQEELEAQPEFDEATYAERRDEMRMQVQ